MSHHGNFEMIFQRAKVGKKCQLERGLGVFAKRAPGYTLAVEYPWGFNAKSVANGRNAYSNMEGMLVLTLIN